MQVESDGEDEDEASHTDSSIDSKTKTANKAAPSSTTKPLAASEGSSDGELVEFPDSETEQTSRSSVAEKAL